MNALLACTNFSSVPNGSIEIAFLNRAKTKNTKEQSSPFIICN